MKNYLILIVLFITLFTHKASAQVIDNTGFESYADETAYTLTSWQSDGFTVPWVNGFNQNRAFVDDAFAKFGTKSLRIQYPANGFGPSNSGAQAPLTVPPANELFMSYWVRFSDNFDWGGTSEGGKLPGLGGGGRCSGCTVCTGSNGFTARLMWRTGGKAVLYLYHMEADKANGPCGDNDALQLSPGVDFYFQKGQWYNVVQRVKVNTGTNHDGEVQLWINGQQALLRTGIQFVSNGDKVDNLYFSTFHGGSTSGWAPSVDCYTWFDDMKIASTLADVLPSTNQAPSISITAPATNSNKCVGESLLITTNATDSDGSISKVEFYNGTTLLGTTSNTPFNFTISSLSLGTHSITAKAFDNLNATTTSPAITVIVTALPTATITSPSNSFCAGGSVILTASAGATYKWLNGTTPAGTAASLTATAAGSYTVEVTNAAGCKATSAAKAITIDAAPTATITASSSTTFPQGGSVDLVASAGTSYVWKNGASSVGSSQTFTAIISGSYTVEITNAAGCKAVSAPTTVTVSTTTSIVTSNAATEIITTPMPFNESTHIVLRDGSMMESIVVTSLEGKIVYSMFDINASELDFGQDLSSGLYTVKINSSNGVHLIRIIKK